MKKDSPQGLSFFVLLGRVLNKLFSTLVSLLFSLC